MKNLLIAAGVGALLVVAQTAVSAAYHPLDRVDATATGDVAAPMASGAKSVNRPASAFDAAYAPLDMASGNPVFGSDEITAGAPRREIPVTDRVSGETGRYNLALDAVSEEETCVKTIGPFEKKGLTTPVGGKMSVKCDPDIGDPSRIPIPIFALPVIISAAVVVNDSGKSD